MVTSDIVFVHWFSSVFIWRGLGVPGGSGPYLLCAWGLSSIGVNTKITLYITEEGFGAGKVQVLEGFASSSYIYNSLVLALRHVTLWVLSAHHTVTLGASAFGVMP